MDEGKKIPLNLEEIKKLPKEKKEKFMFCDLAERMMRVERHVSASFRKPITYQQTEYYKSLNPKQQQEFKEFLKNKKLKKLCLASLFVTPLLLFLLLRINLTGSIIKENVGYSSFYNLELVIIAVIALIIVIFMFIFISKKKHDKRLNKHFRIIRPIIARRHTGYRVDGINNKQKRF